LRRFLSAASKRGIIVELTAFSKTYADNWALNPFRAKNNKQGVGNIEWPEYVSLKDKELLRRQAEYARKIIRETSEFDNVYYEICNEPAAAQGTFRQRRWTLGRNRLGALCAMKCGS
jgi:hypothetical protein